ncbi:CDP-alcohol phosphatidyltransferase family protein [bacterium]|nr:CDP-alcohol phosphatidyltransferase family protein [bacterium]
MKYILPWGLIFSRVLFAPLVIYLSTLPDTWVGPVVVAIIWFALIGDILDGIIARSFGIATPLMRRADSIADLIFWLGVGTAIWIWRPGIFRPHLWWIRVALLMECLTYVVSFLKFGKELAAHAYSGKLLGIGILLGFTHLWWTGVSQWTLYMMLILANLSQLDRFGIALFLPRWTPDTPSTYHAWRIKKGLPIKKYKLFHGV